MVAKLVLVMLVLAVLLVAAVVAAYRYFDNRASEQHEIQKMREERDAELLTGESMDSIDRELEREKNK